MSLRTSTFIAPSDAAVAIACFHSSSAGASFEAINLVPRLTPAAPSISAAATLISKLRNRYAMRRRESAHTPNNGSVKRFARPLRQPRPPPGKGH